MFGKNKPQSRIDSLIGAGTKVEGHITFSGGLRIDGEVHGNISVPKDQSGTLVVSEKARVEGEVSVSHLVVNGTIVGPVHVQDTLELQPSSRVTGDVEYKQLEMQPGSIVQGRLVHHAEAKSGAADLKLAANRS